jgi:integrase
MTIDQAQRFLDVCMSRRLGATSSLARLLRLRRGEVIGLKWMDIEVDGDVIKLRMQTQLVRLNKSGVQLADWKRSRAGEHCCFLRQSEKSAQSYFAIQFVSARRANSAMNAAKTARSETVVSAIGSPVRSARNPIIGGPARNPL